MRLIPSTKGRFAVVDDEDYERLVGFRWYAHSNSGGRDIRPARRTSVREGRKVVFMHHEILPKREGMMVDHINGDPWDNRRCNLRYCTNAENIRNQSGHRNRKAPYKGVQAKRRGFQATITAEGKSHYLGYFRTPEAAARAYDEAALEMHGEFARRNLPAA